MKCAVMRTLIVLIINGAAVIIYEPFLHLFIRKAYGDGGIGQGLLIVSMALPCLVIANMAAAILIVMGSKRGQPPGAIYSGFLPAILFAIASLIIPAIYVGIDREVRIMALTNVIYFMFVLHALYRACRFANSNRVR